jgi:hypothetical protein
MTYGGDEEIVLKGGAKKSVKAGKDGKVVEQKCIYAAFIRSYFARIQTDVGQREYNIYKGQKKYPWSGSYTPGKDKVRRSIS